MKLSVVTTLYYSESYLEEFCKRCFASARQITQDVELILVNDGSPDNSLLQALEIQKKMHSIKIIDLSRNFGHHKAIMTGLSFAQGDYVFLIDCDLEEAPELLDVFWPNIVNHSVDVVYGVQRNRKGQWFERFSGQLFYQFFKRISSLDYPADSLTARLMTRQYVQSVLSFREKELDIWGVFVLTGYNQKAVVVEKGHKGSSTYTLSRKVRMAIEVITTLSHRPLYLTFLFGVIFLFLSFVSILVILSKKYLQQTVEGWASIMALIWFVGGVILFVLGIFGIYLSKIFLEVKNRPLTIIKEIYPPGDGSKA